MKKFLTFIKRVLLGLLPAAQGAIVVYGLQKAITCFKITTVSQGWAAVLFCFEALSFLALMLWFLYDLGKDCHDAMDWRAHKREEAVQTIDGSSDDCETSDEATDTSSEPVTKKRKSKKKND